MAKKSAIAKNNYRKELSARWAPIRKELRNKAVNMNLSDEERWEAQLKLQKFRRDTSSCRVVSRCHLTGRPRGVLRKFGLSRIAVRTLALEGKLPGVTKASW